MGKHTNSFPQRLEDQLTKLLWFIDHCGLPTRGKNLIGSWLFDRFGPISAFSPFYSTMLFWGRSCISPLVVKLAPTAENIHR